MSNNTLLVIYDAQCGLCRGARQWLEERAPSGAMEFIDCRSEERMRKAPGVSEQACLEAIHVVEPGGCTWAGADAMPVLLARIPRWRWLGTVLRWPGFRHLARPAYRAIARQRLRLSALFSRREPEETCEEGECSLR